MRIKDFFARHGWLVAVAVVYLYVVPYFPRIHSANELPRIYLVKAIVEDHTFAIDRGVATWGPTADVSPSGDHQYSNKAPGSSLLAAPVYAVVAAIAGPQSLATTLWISRLVAGIVPTLAFLWLLWGFLARFAPDPAVRRVVVLAYALGSMALTYSILFYSHQLGAICIASAWIFAVDGAERRRGRYAFVAAGFFAGASALVDYQAVFAAVPVAVHAVMLLWRWPRRELAGALGLAVAGAALPIAILLGYHAVCFGSPWRTGYDASTSFAFYHQHGFLGITELRAEALVGSLVRPDNGLFALSPWWLLAIPGWILMVGRPTGRRHIAEASAGVIMFKLGVLANHAELPWWIAVGALALGTLAIIDGLRRATPPSPERGAAGVGFAVAIVFVLFVSSINFWRGGWEVGPRYITALLPFLLPGVAVALTRARERPALFGACAGLIGVGVAIYVLSAATFPYWPDSVHHPLYDVTFRMLGDNLVAPNLGSAVGVPGIAGLAPYLAVAFGMVGFAIWRVARTTGLAIACGVAVAILLGYGAYPHGDARADAAYQTVRAAALDL